MLACLLLATSLFVGCHAQAKADIKDANLKRMVELYREFALPLPPKDAKLLLVYTGARGTGGVGPESQIVSLALQAPGRDGPVYYGLSVVAPSKIADKRMQTSFRVIRPDDPMIAHAQSTRSPLFEVFEHDSLLATGIQLAAIGRVELGAQVVKNTKSQAHMGRTVWLGAGKDRPEKRIAQLVIAQVLNGWVKPNSDRKGLLAVVSRMVASGHYEKEEANILQQYATGMQAAVRPITSNSNTIEGVIDRLIDSHGSSQDGTTYLPDSAFRSLVVRGFEAIPTMIARLNDQAFTRSYKLGFNNFQTRIQTIGDVMRDALFLYAAEDTHMNYGWISNEEIGAWWANASKIGEKEYCRTHLIPPRKKKDPSGLFSTRVYPNEALLALCEEKYPEIIREAADRVKKDRQDVEAESIDRALARIGTPRGNGG